MGTSFVLSALLKALWRNSGVEEIRAIKMGINMVVMSDAQSYDVEHSDGVVISWCFSHGGFRF